MVPATGHCREPGVSSREKQGGKGRHLDLGKQAQAGSEHPILPEPEPREKWLKRTSESSPRGGSFISRNWSGAILRFEKILIMAGC